MDRHSDRKYESFKIPENSPRREKKGPAPAARTDGASRKHPQDGLFYEIEYDAAPWPGVGKYVLKSAAVQPPPRDEIRERFARMRDIARGNTSWYSGSSRFYDSSIQREKGSIFYKQAMFMKDFEDDYDKSVPYSSYDPFYQMMGYEQLRTYFTWRTKIRKGVVEENSVSYAFLYIYELLNNIGMKDPSDGLEKLMFFWKTFREYDQTIDKYMVRWLKDYHVYYELPHSFREFVTEHNLESCYPQILKSGDDFDLMCSVSKYDLRKSVFYTEDRRELIRNCFSYTTEKVRQAFRDAGMDYDEYIFLSPGSMSVWTPFQHALFFPWLRQPDRRVVLSESEIYVCSQNTWRFHKTIISESGRKLLGYVMKQMEAVLRKITKYKYSITAGIRVVNPATVTLLAAEGISLEELITEAVKEFYREATKTVVRVNPAALDKIRREALVTQEKLTVEEDGPPEGRLPAVQESSLEEIPSSRESSLDEIPASQESSPDEIPTVREDTGAAEKSASPEKSVLPEEPALPEEPSIWNGNGTETDEPWAEFRASLNSAEFGALEVILNGETDLKQYADRQEIMVEVLADGINEKAMDALGDSILDEEFEIYEDYAEQVKEMVRK